MSFQQAHLDDLDLRLIAILRRDGRRSVSDLADDLGVSRATVRSRMQRLSDAGQIVGFTVQLRADLQEAAIRAIMLIQVEGKHSDQVIQRLGGMPEVTAIHATNGRWDLVAELGTPDLPSFDDTLRRIRLIEGIAATETNLLLSTRKRVGAAQRG